MIIERLAVEDVDAVADLFDAYRKFYHQPSDIPAAKQFLKARLLKEDSILFVAKMDHQCVGFTQLYPTFSSVAMKRAFILNDLYVAEDYRRHGIAEKLMEQAFQFAKQHDARSIALETGALNTKAQALYEKVGMEVETDVKHYIYYW